MKIRDLAIVVGLVVLLTWLLIRGLGPADPETQAALRALDHYVATQSALHRDVLRARAGLLRNYDPIVDHMAAMDRDLGTVRDNLGQSQRTILLAPIVADLREQELLTERFKGGNALLQNSLSYFGLFSSRLSHSWTQNSLTHGVDGLAGDMLHLTLDTSSATIEEVGAELAEAEAICRKQACPEDASGLIAHGRLLHDLLPAVDRGLAALVRTDRSAPVRRLRAHLEQREQSVEAASVRFRLLLYGASLLFLFFLFKGEVQLRARARDLRRQVALEHAVASLSARLIGGGARTKTLVESGLEQLGEALGAKRAYFYRGRSGTFCTWPATGEEDAGRMAALHLARLQDRRKIGIVHLRIGDRATGPIEAALMRRLDTTGWIAVLRSAESSLDCFLAFEMDETRGTRLPRQLTVLRTAFDAICLAFGHEYAEAERQRLTEQLAHARRMETIGAFASGIAHNFNNLIGAIGGYAEMAQARIHADSQSCHCLDQIQLAAERGRSLVEGLLDYGRRREQHREPVDLTLLTSETRELAEAALGPSHAIELVEGMNHAPVVIDPAQVQQVLLNLCRNAAQAMEEGGTIRIETAISVLDQPLLHPHGPVPAGRYATVTVHDSGIGIAPGELRRLFEPFYTTKASGNGLGLATAREIVVDFDGVITIDSQPGVGTDACVWLPLSAETSGAQSPSVSAAYAKGNGEVVLLMVEDPARRLSNEEMVAALGYEPIGVETPERLLEIVDRGAHGFDAIMICATELTEERWALLADLQSRCPAAPRLLAVGSAGRLQAGRLAQAGVSAIVQCPPRAGELSSALQRCLGRPSSSPRLQVQLR